jgi:hypothetical protein
MNAEQQRLAANQKKMQAEIDAMQANVKYPAGLVPGWFKEALDRALKHESQQSLGCDWEMLKSIRLGDPRFFTMAQMGHALNAIESKTEVQIDVPGFSYEYVMDGQQEMAIKWNEIVAPLRAEIIKKYQNVPPLFIPSGKKIKR